LGWKEWLINPVSEPPSLDLARDLSQVIDQYGVPSQFLVELIDGLLDDLENAVSIQWHSDVDHAIRTALRLNDRWALDGRSSNGVANILWCFGLHDRPFIKRPRFGMVRPLGKAGVRRNLDLDGYLRWTHGLLEAA
jgi:hypothetical protein